MLRLDRLTKRYPGVTALDGLTLVVPRGLVGLVGATVSFWQGSWLTLAVFVLGIGAWELHERMAHPVKVAIDAAQIWLGIVEDQFGL